jgi:AraC family ethanolamine operon transcriptional activator
MKKDYPNSANRSFPSAVALAILDKSVKEIVVEPQIFSLESQDFQEMEHALSAWDHCYAQVSPGAFRGSIFSTQIGSLAIFRNRWERAIHYLGIAPAGTIGLAISLTQTGIAHWMGEKVGFNDVIIQRPGSEAEYISASVWDSVVFAIPEAEFAQCIASLTHDDPDEMLKAHGVIRLSPEVAAQLREISMAYLHAAERPLARLGEPSPLPEMARSTVERVALALVDSWRSSKTKPRHRRQQSLLRRAEEFCEHHANQPLRIGELCSELSASERTLRYAFQELTGNSPLDYLKMQRLNRTRRALHTGDPAKTQVKQVALENGFFHLGHFSRDYKNLFGELPTQTIQRP